MINIKFSVISGCAGLLLSLAVGFVSGAGFPHVLIRAGIFGVIFFAAGSGLWLLLNNFVPELLSPDKSNEDEGGDSAGAPGSRVNITLDDSRVLPEMYRNLDNGDDVGNIGDLVSGAFQPEAVSPEPLLEAADAIEGMDQKPEDGYTGNRSWSGVPANGSSEGLPDLDSMAGSFMGSQDETTAQPVEWSEPERRVSGNKPQKLEGDFNPKDIAAGIRTVLSKDE
ncbi:MAG TPA: hypothetical protein DEQ14_00365 [Treponema sp.]|nr:hypothetical protein [Treponema sp.]